MPLSKNLSQDCPPEVENIRIYLTAIVVAWAGLLFGYDSSFIGTTVTQPSFQRDFGLDKLTDSENSLVSSNIISVFQAGCFFGAFFGFLLMESFGRKLSLIIADIVFIIGAVLQVAATDQLGLIYAGRVLVGLGVGILTCAAPVFLAEISPSSIRGRLVGFYEIGYQLAAVVGFWINYGIKQNMNVNLAKAWRIPMGVQLIPAGILLIGCIFVKETPRYLLKVGKDDDALKNLCFIRNLPADHEHILQEINATKEQIKRESSITSGDNGMLSKAKGLLDEISKKGIRNRVAIGFFMMCFQNMVGTNSINYYSPTIFSSIGIQDVNLYTGIYGVIKAVASFVFLIWLVDTWGRRPPLILGGIVCAICMYYIGAYIKIASPSPGSTMSASDVAGGKAAVAAIMIFGWFFCISWNGLAWIYCAEIYPIKIRSFCAALTAMFQWLFQFIIARTTSNMVQTMGYGMFLLFGTFAVFAAVFAYFFVLETAGLRLEDVDRLFGYHDNLAEHVEEEYVEEKNKENLV